MDGRSVTVNGQSLTLHTAGAEVIEVPTTFLEQFLQTLTDPNLVFLLLSVGVQAILIELSSPGGWVAGFIGVVCIALAVFGLGVLPVNWFGIVFLVLAFVLFVRGYQSAHPRRADRGRDGVVHRGRAGAVQLAQRAGLPTRFGAAGGGHGGGFWAGVHRPS